MRSNDTTTPPAIGTPRRWCWCRGRARPPARDARGRRAPARRTCSRVVGNATASGSACAARIVVGVGEALAGIGQPAVAEQGGEFAAQVGGQRGHVLRILPGVRRRRVSACRGSARRMPVQAIVGAERVAQPVQARRCRIAVGLDHVEAAGGVARTRGAPTRNACAARTSLRRLPASTEAAPPPKRDDRGGSALRRTPGGGAVEHHQVEFAEAVVRVAPRLTQPGAQQVGARGGFDRGAAGAAVGARA